MMQIRNTVMMLTVYQSCSVDFSSYYLLHSLFMPVNTALLIACLNVSTAHFQHVMP